MSFDMYKEIIDKLLKIQDRFYPDVAEYYQAYNGRVALLRLVGMDGGSLLLKLEKGRIKYAQGNENPIHIFKMSTDTFINILIGAENIREAWTKGHFVIEDASTGEVNIIELQRWSKAFESLRGILTKYVVPNSLKRGR